MNGSTMMYADDFVQPLPSNDIPQNDPGESFDVFGQISNIAYYTVGTISRAQQICDTSYGLDYGRTGF